MNKKYNDTSQKDATEFTKDIFSNILEDNGYEASLNNQKINAAKGLLAEKFLNLNSKDGTCNFDTESYRSFLGKDKICPDTIHPMLWHEANLNMNVGLFRVNRIEENSEEDINSKNLGGKFKAKKGDVFQVRGFDISNLTVVKGETGWIVMDVLTSVETANEAINFLNTEIEWDSNIDESFDNKNHIRAIVCSHSHVDHYAGIKGLADKSYIKEEVKGDKVNDVQEKDKIWIYTPEGFLENVISENVYAGNAMASRAIYMYGFYLKHDAKGQVDAGIGKATSNGTRSLYRPTVNISMDMYEEGKRYWEKTIDGIRLQFQLTPGTEAPVEMNVYMPDEKVLFIAENCSGTLHNLYTLRGAQVRDPLSWAEYLNETIESFTDIETLCSAHNWPHFGKEECYDYISLQRDVYRYLANTSLNLINKGYTIENIGRKMESMMPDEIKNEWCNHGFYGTVNHNAKAIYQKYIGWYDGNPSNLNKIDINESASKYVKCMGGFKKVLKFAEEALRNGEYAWAAELLNKLIFSDIQEKEKLTAKAYNADALEQLGYQSESSAWRNEYLTAAKVLRESVKGNDNPLGNRKFELEKSVIESMTPRMLIQYIGIMFNGYEEAKSKDVDGEYGITFTDDSSNDNQITLYIKHGVLSCGKYKQGLKEIFKGSRMDFYNLVMGKEKIDNEDIKKILAYIKPFKSNFKIVTE